MIDCTIFFEGKIAQLLEKKNQLIVIINRKEKFRGNIS